MIGSLRSWMRIPENGKESGYSSRRRYNVRIIYPKEIREEIDYVSQFLVFNGKENVVRDDAPEGVKERREALIFVFYRKDTEL